MHCWVTLTLLMGVSVWFLSLECSCALWELGQSQESSSVFEGLHFILWVGAGTFWAVSICTTMNEWSLPDTVVFLFFFFIIHQEANLAQAPKVMTKISFLFWSLPGSLRYLCWLGELVLSSKGGSSTSHVPRTRPRARKAPLWEHFWPFLNETCCGFEPGIDRGRGTAVMFL